MKRTKLLLSCCAFLPLVTTPFVTSCSSENLSSKVIDVVNAKFNKDPENLGTVANEQEAIAAYKNILDNNDNKKNEVIFDCFNFIAAKNLTIQGKQYTPDNKSFLDLKNDKKVKMDATYDMLFNEVGSNYFTFQMQGWFTCQYEKDVDNFKSGDYVQFVFDINANVYVVYETTIEGDKCNMSVNYEFTAPSNDEEIFGIIKSKINDTFYPTYGISDMKDINFENPELKLPYYRGYYLISEA